PTPTLSSIEPLVGVPGTTVPVTLTGTNFVAGATEIADIAGITIIGAGVITPTSMVATFKIDLNAALGARNVTVTTAAGTSGAATVAVVEPLPALTRTSAHVSNSGDDYNEAYIVAVSNPAGSASVSV